MSEDNKIEGAEAETTKPEVDKPAAAATDEGGAGILNTLKTNASARYALIGAVVAVILISFMGGGSSVTEVKVAQISVGQSVTVENPNGGNSQLTVAPGMMAASADPDDTEQNVCLVKGAAKATVEEEQMAGMLSYVKVKVLDGDCQGKSGWTSKVNIRG